LSVAKLGFQLAASVRCEQFTGVEPVLCSSSCEHSRKFARELGVLRTSKVPEGRGVDRLVKTQDFFDTTVAVGGDDKVLPW